MDNTNAPWTVSRDDFDLANVISLRQGRRLCAIIPAKNEAATIGAVIDSVRSHKGFVDEVFVVNDHSHDDTHSVSVRHGARVIELDGATGKGEALAAGVAATTCDVVVFLDADVIDPSADYVARMVQPLFERPEIQLVKGYYERPLKNMPTGGGRVNELAARPILSLLYPDLAEIRQPLAGESALRRDTLDALNLERGYGVEIALLIDVALKFGRSSLAQVDLGVRRHRNRPLEELRPMAVEILRVALTRFDVELPVGT